ncbi:MAG: hypothetical protein RLZZ142_1026 [Verrucomicrobiota bacterium]
MGAGARLFEQEAAFGFGLKEAPAFPGVVRAVGDVSQEAAPFEQGAFEVAHAEGFAEELLFAASEFDDAADGLGGSGAVIVGETEAEVSLEVRVAEGALAGEGEATEVACVFFGEAGAAAQVGDVEDEFVERVGGVFEGGGDGESLAVLEEGEENATAGGGAVGFDESEGAPGVGGGVLNGGGFAPGALGAGGADGGGDASFGGLEEGASGGVAPRLLGGLGVGEADEELVGAWGEGFGLAAAGDLGEGGEHGFERGGRIGGEL